MYVKNTYKTSAGSCADMDSTQAYETTDQNKTIDRINLLSSYNTEGIKITSDKVESLGMKVTCLATCASKALRGSSKMNTSELE